MYAKLSIVEEEADESLYWLDVLDDTGLTRADQTHALKKEANEILAMIVASKKTLQRGMSASANRGPATQRPSSIDNQQSTIDNRTRP